MDVQSQLCPICGSDGTERTPRRNDAISFKCRRCGSFQLTGTAEVVARGMECIDQTVANMSGWLWEHQGVVLDDRELRSLLDLRSPSVGERALKLLKELARRFPA